ncbi:hypothetical protein B0H13DRAFT_1496176, partial [Mycena leptocephala]
TEEYLRRQLSLPPKVSINLWAVPEPADGGRPTTPLPMLIKLAIHGSGKERLTLREICAELAKRFQWYREHD